MATFYNPFTKKYEQVGSATVSGGNTKKTTFYNPITKSNEPMGQTQVGSEGAYDEETLKLIQEAQRRGIKIPETVTKKSPSILNRLFGFLNLGETAPAAMAAIKGQDPLKAYGSSVAKRATLGGMEGPSYGDVLKELGVPEGKLPIGSLRGLAGLGMDIALDPMTYFGVGLASRAARGLKSLGKGGVKVASKIPIVGEKVVKPATKVISETGDALGKAFIPYYTAKKAPGGEEFVQSLTKLPQAIRGKTNLQVQEMISKLLKGKPAKMDPQTYLDALREGLEKVSKTKGLTTDTTQYLQDLLKRIGKGEQQSGVLERMIGEGQMGLFSKNDKGYFPRQLTKEGREFFAKDMDPSVVRYRELGIQSGPELARKFMPGKTVSEINEKFGKKIFEDNPARAISERIYEGVQRTETANFFRKIADNVDKVPYVSSKAKPGWVKMSENISGFKIPGLSGVYVPREIYNELNKVSSTLTSDESVKGVLKLYDKVLGWWKGSVTTRFPGFHIRNWYGATFNNYIMGVTNPLRYEQAYKLAKKSGDSITLGGKKYTYEQLNKILTESGAVGGQGYFDIMKSVGDKATDLFKQKSPLSKLVPGESWMEGIETNVRGALFIDQLAKGKNVDEAVKTVFKAHFDYAPEAMTKFEQEYMKRIIPFYRWIRGNIPFQIQQIAKQPTKYANIAKAMRVAGGDQEQSQYLPEYMQRNFPIKWGEKDGKTSFLYGMGLPVEDINRLDPREMIQQLSPAITTPMELATKQNLYFGKPLAESNYAPGFFSKLPQPLKDVLEYNEYTTSKGKQVGRVDPVKWKLLTSILGRYVYTLDKLTTEEVSPLVNFLNFTTGAKLRTVNPEEEKTRRTRELMEQIGDYLYGKGAVNRFQRYYVPKSK